MAAIQVNIRYPELLLKRIDAVAEGNRSEWILEACRMRLDGAAKEEFVKHWEQKFDEVSIPTNPDMQALRDVCAGMIVKPDDPYLTFEQVSRLAARAEVPVCLKDWWEDGNHYECLMDKGHKEAKHGLRGMVRIVD